MVREALRDFFDHLAGSELVDMKELRQDMQARRQRALNNFDHLQGVEEAFKELISMSLRHDLSRYSDGRGKGRTRSRDCLFKRALGCTASHRL